MPIASNPSEELLLEWLLIEGYLGLINVRLSSKERGGTSEADVVGFKLCNENNEKIFRIIHVETGSLSSNFDKQLKKIHDKFSNEHEEAIKSIALDRIQIDRETVTILFRKIYVATYVSKKQKIQLEQKLLDEKIEFFTIADFINNIIRPAIPKWKEKRKHLGLTKGLSTVSIPENYWFLQLIEWMEESFK